MIRKKFDSISKQINTHFDFLFDRGYKIRDIREFPMGGWEVVLSSSDMNIGVYSAEGQIDLGFFPIRDRGHKSHISIGIMIYYLSHGEKYIGRFKRYIFNNRERRFEILSALLRQYLDQITPYFGDNFEEYEHELILAKQEYNKIFSDKYLHKPRHRFWG